MFSNAFPKFMPFMGSLSLLLLSSSSDLQPGMGLGLLKQISPATSILGIRHPISTTQFRCFFL